MKRGLALIAVLLSTTGCQMGYYLHSAYHQSKLIGGRTTIERALRSESLTEEQKRKLRLVQAVKEFSESDLGLKHSSNYTTFSQTEGPYVTYIVQAAAAYELKPYLWKFPFVGKVPYKGYFVRSMAEEEAATFNKDEFDTYIRGVSAYSTLGWFQDSVLSSMLRYADYDLVDTIIHETVHTTLFIKNAAQFNERMANFLGGQGMRLYYLKMEGPSSKAVASADADGAAQKLFSAFITREIESLKKWFTENKGKITRDQKMARLKEIQTRFTTELRPKLGKDAYLDFEKSELNNAKLLAYQTYEYDQASFEKAWSRCGQDFKRTLAYFKTLEKVSSPEKSLKEFADGTAACP